MGDFNGWSNWETWNCALWVGNSETLMMIAEKSISYDDFIAKLKGFAGDADLSEMTPDGARWEDADYSEMNDMISEF